jgi:beta-1,4-mannosyl-glycoprotein beta-1,4-N-acetylglucosaminyltransferase
MYNGESLILLIRLRTLSPIVHHFIIGYSTSTFSGRQSRPLHYAPYESQILEFSSQLLPLPFNMSTVDDNTWHREKASRHHLLLGVRSLGPRPDDLCIISDADEIPKASAIRYLVQHPPSPAVQLRAHFFYYSMRHENPIPWIKIGVVRYGGIRVPFGHYRGMQGIPVLRGFKGVHCSYCFGHLKEVIRKLETFPHWEYSSGRFVDPNYIYAKVACGESLFPGSVKFKQVEYRTHELDLPVEADHLAWRMPFKDLHLFNLNVTAIEDWGRPCKPRLDFVEGKLRHWA